MTDSMKFGPEWLRNLSADGTQNPPAPKYQLAEHRYGREEMLALFDRQVKAPDRLVALPALYIEKTQQPLALIQMNEEETRMWNRGINSDAVLRLNGKAVGPASIPSTRGGLVVGRGGSVDRGRGRARGQGYHYTRGMSYEESGDASMQEPISSGIKITTYNRNINRPFDRAQSMAGVERGWSERNGGEPQDWNGSTSPRKEFVRGFDNNWRRPRGSVNGVEDEDGWRTATGSGSTKYVRPSSWREGDKEGAVGEVGGGRWIEQRTRNHRGWDGDSDRHQMDPDNLPEWAMENPSESGGSFDASGAFHGGGHSDEEDMIAQDSIPPDSVKLRSPDDAKKPSQPSSHITKSQSTSALPSTNHTVKPPSPAKSATTQQQQQQQKQSNQNPVKKSTSANAIPVPSPTLNNGTDIMYPPTTAPSSHFPLLNTVTKQNKNNLVGYEVDAVGYHVAPASSNGYAVVNSASVLGRPRKSEDDLARMQVDADSFVDKLTADEEEKKLHQMAAIGQQGHDLEKWFYRDPQSEVQGPFNAHEMDEWFRAGYFNVNLLIRRGCDERFATLGDLIKEWGRVPFLAGPYVPPLKNETASPVSLVLAPVAQQAQPSLEQESLMQQQQYQYQTLLHRQHIQQQAAFQAVLGKLSQTERWASLTTVEQQQLVMQQMMDPSVFLPPPPQPQKNPVLQQFISQMKPTEKPPLPPLHPLQQLIQQMGGGQSAAHQMLHGQQQEVGGQDPLQSLIRQINANKPPPQMDLWGNPLTAAPSWMSQAGQMPAAPPPGQLPMSMWDIQGKDMKTEQQIIEERIREEEEKRVEEAMMKKAEAEEKRRKHKEEMIKIKELEKQRLEEERQRIEVARRKEEDEKQMQELQEHKRLEEIRKREKEEKKRKEEEKKKREEEKKRKEEEKERKRKLEEEKKREEEEKKRLEEEAAQKRQEEEEQVRRVEQQHQAFKRLQERAKAAPWSQQAAKQPAGNSLAEIQRQEKVQKERESREQQLSQQSTQLAQQQQQQQAAAQQAQADKNNLQLKWADRKLHVAKVKSLSEIQAEEAKQCERERAERAVKEVAVQPSAGIWSAAPQSLSWATAGNAAWNSQQGGGGFWDDVASPAPPAPVSRPATKAKSAPSQSAPSPAAPKAAPAKTRNKKEEAVVMKLFDNQRGDDFTHWCSTSLQTIEAHVDIPTFVGFLRDIESPYEVKDYVKMYLGESKESQEFARQFLERRSKWRSAQRAAPQHDDLAQPAPAINPSSQDFQEVKGKAKKMKKNKMCKVDSRILGFSVTAAQDRINVGDRDYGEGV